MPAAAPESIPYGETLALRRWLLETDDKAETRTNADTTNSPGMNAIQPQRVRNFANVAIAKRSGESEMLG